MVSIIPPTATELRATAPVEQVKVYHDICLTVSVIPKAMTSYPNRSRSTPENEGTPEASRVRGGEGRNPENILGSPASGCIYA